MSNDWDSCYRRGLSYAQGECWDQAIDQFYQAISQRHKDQWYARSYGMHVLEEYFPHRELGCIYLHQGDPNRAIEELSLSLEMADSGRAKYYLNQARQRWLEERGLDHTPPAIRFHKHDEGRLPVFHTNASMYEVTGEAIDDYFVSTVIINDQPLFIDLAMPVISFKKRISLKPGENQICCKVIDLAGNEQQKDFLVELDQQGPTVIIGPDAPSGIYTDHASAELQSGKMRMIKCLIFDSGGLDAFTIGAREIPFQRGERLREFRLEISPNDAPGFWARDLAGNVTKGDLAMIWENKESISSGPLSEYFNSDNNTAGQEDVPLFRIAANNSFVPHNPSYEKIPKIFIEHYSSIVFQPIVVIQGRIESACEISGLWINEEPLLSSKEHAGLLHALHRFWYGERTLFYFTRLFQGLKEGENRLTILAEDKDGRIAQKGITVEYRVPEIERIQNRWCLALMPFLIYKAEQPLLAPPSPGSLNFLREMLYLAFFRTERFQIVERDRIDTVMSELMFSTSDCIDKATASRLGNLLFAETLLVGSFQQWWDGRDWCLDIVARLVEVETGNILAVENVYNRWSNAQDASHLLSGLAQRFKEKFPVVQGRILDKTPDRDRTKDREAKEFLVMSMTKADLIKEGMKVLIYQQVEEIKNETVLGEARVKKVTEDFSVALPSQRDLLDSVRIGDHVITK